MPSLNEVFFSFAKVLPKSSSFGFLLHYPLISTFGILFDLRLFLKKKKILTWKRILHILNLDICYSFGCIKDFVEIELQRFKVIKKQGTIIELIDFI